MQSNHSRFLARRKIFLTKSSFLRIPNRLFFSPWNASSLLLAKPGFSASRLFRFLRWSISRSFSNAWYKYTNNISIASTASEELEELAEDVDVGFSSILKELVDVDSLYGEDEVMISVLDTLNDDVVSSPQPQSQLLLLVLVEVEVESVGVDVSLDVLDDVMVELVESVLVSVSSKAEHSQKFVTIISRTSFIFFLQLYICCCRWLVRLVD